MKRLTVAVLTMLALTPLMAAQRGPGKPLEIYVVDTEGGKATLFVSPAGQSLLIDSGNPGMRDTDRIMEVISAAGVKQIDFLLSTHYHVDHWLGLPGMLKTSRSGKALQPDGIESQTIFKNNFPAFNRADMPEGRGFLVQRGRCELLQVGCPT